MVDPEELPFTDSAQSLFSSEEMRGLMRAEIARAKRYAFPLSLYLVGIDRLEALHDLYGVGSKAEIFQRMLAVLRQEVRASDFVASLEGDRLMLLAPYVDRAGAKRLGLRLLEGARRLRFESDNRDLKVTLSIGLGHAATPDPDAYDALFAAADDGQRLARRSGGDRLIEVDVLDAGPERPAATRRGESPGRGDRPGRGSAAEAPGEAAPSLTNPLAGLAPEDVLTVVRDALRQLGIDPTALETRAAGETEGQTPAAGRGGEGTARAGAGGVAPRETEYDLHERRISKLATVVEELQRQIAALNHQSPVEAGLASLGKVFGTLGAGGEGDDKRKQLMGALFQANLSLQRRKRDQGGGE
jgi:diguanylate cyclase (GGDEF)-like protein